MPPQTYTHKYMLTCSAWPGCVWGFVDDSLMMGKYFYRITFQQGSVLQAQPPEPRFISPSLLAFIGGWLKCFSLQTSLIRFTRWTPKNKAYIEISTTFVPTSTNARKFMVWQNLVVQNIILFIWKSVVNLINYYKQKLFFFIIWMHLFDQKHKTNFVHYSKLK